MRILIVFILPLFLSSLTLPCRALDPNVRVRLFSRLELSKVVLTAAQAEIRLVSARGEEEAFQVSDAEIRVDLDEGLLRASSLPGLKKASRIRILPRPGSLGRIDTLQGPSARFGGALAIGVSSNRLRIVEELPLESYVEGVLRAELPPETPIEALKAQAVLIRTYAAKPRHAREGFDFCDLTHCQAYRPGQGPGDAYRVAARATRGMILTYGARPIEALYHSSCGGYTSPNQKVFGGKPLPYLQGVADGDYCRASPQAHWESRASLGEIEAILPEGRGPLRQIRIAEAEEGGRAYRLEFLREGRQGLSAQDFLLKFGSRFGWDVVKSAWFQLEIRHDEVLFRGRGLGHGVGLCQWGARGMALAGRRFDEILAHYFPGTRLTRRGS